MELKEEMTKHKENLVGLGKKFAPIPDFILQGTLFAYLLFFSDILDFRYSSSHLIQKNDQTSSYECNPKRRPKEVEKKCLL